MFRSDRPARVAGSSAMHSGSKSASQGAWGSYCAVGRPELGRIGDGPFGHTELSSSPS